MPFSPPPGNSSLAIGGPSVDAKEPRRSIYTKLSRNTPEPLLDVFDAPEGITSTAQRNVTTTPPQALSCSTAPSCLARPRPSPPGLSASKTDDPIERAYRLAFGRSGHA